METPIYNDDGSILYDEFTGKPKMKFLGNKYDWYYRLHDLIDELNDNYRFIQVGMQSFKINSRQRID